LEAVESPQESACIETRLKARRYPGRGESDIAVYISREETDICVADLVIMAS
jgi:hypothetical protein